METDASGIGDPVHGGTADRVPWPRQTKAFAVRTLRTLFRNRSALVWGLVAPVFFYGLFGLEGSAAERASTAVAFGVFGAFAVSLVIFAQSLSDDLSSRRYRKLRSLPVSPSADAIGRFLGGFALSVVSFLLVIGAGLATGADIALRSPVSVAVVAVSLFLFCLIAMAGAVVVASVLDEGEYIVGVTNLLMLGAFYLTGYNGIAPGAAPGSLGEYVNVAPNALATRLAIHHLAPTATSTGHLSPPALPTGPGWLGLLAAYAVGTALVASLVMWRSVYAGEGGE